MELAAAGLELAKMCWLEAGFSLADCVAMVRVIIRRAQRAGVTPVQAAVAYSALGRAGVRNTFARALPNGPEPAWNGATNRRWAALRAAARRALAGERSPCRGADHFGSRTLPTDQARARRAVDAGRWKPVKCIVDTLQAYYAEVR